MQKFIKPHVVHSFECDNRLRLRVRSLFNLFQDLADEHANEMGLGYHYCHERDLGWIGAAYHVRIFKWPVWEDKLTLATWPSAVTPVAGIRDFTITNVVGEVIVAASSMWVVLDLKRMRPVPVARHMPAYKLVSEKALEPDFTKLEPLCHIDNTRVFDVHVDEIDLYNHVNNAVYPSWILDAFESDFLKEHDLSEIKILFKHPAVYTDKIVMETQIDEKETRHIIRSDTNEKVFADIKAVWRNG